MKVANDSTALIFEQRGAWGTSYLGTQEALVERAMRYCDIQPLATIWQTGVTNDKIVRVHFLKTKLCCNRSCKI